MALLSRYDQNYYTPDSVDPTGFAPFLGTDPRSLGYATWQAAAQALSDRFGPSAVGYAGDHGYFDSYFPDTYAKEGGANILGGYIASKQAEADSDWTDNPVGALTDLALGTAGFGVGGATGAAAATGNIKNSGDLANYLAADAAGLAVGFGISGAMGAGAGTAEAAGAYDAAGLPAVGPTAATSAAPMPAPAAAGGGAASSLAPTVGLPGWAQIAAGAIPAAIGAYASNQQANSYEGLARDYMNMGAPYRSKLSDLYANPSGFLNSPEVTVPVQQGTNALARALSVNGNPMGSGTALQELQNYSSNQLFSRLGQEKDRLAGFGGLSAYNQAAPQASANAIDANYNTYAALGRGSANVFNPPQRYNLPGLAGLY